MSIAAFRRQFAPSFVSPYYEDFTDPEDFIVYSNDVGAVVLYDHVVGFSDDGTYYIRYDFSGGDVDEDNAGMWNEYRYVRSSGGASRTIHSRQQLSPLQSVTDWVLETPNGGNSATEVYLSAAMTITVYIDDLAEAIGDENAEDKFPGTWSVKRTITGPVNNSSDIEVCAFELRTLAVKNFRADAPRFDPCSEQNFTTFKADILALPPGWQPTGELGLMFLVRDEANGVYPVQSYPSWAVDTPDSNGKIAEVEIPWDGTWSASHTFAGDGTHPLDEEPLEGRFLSRFKASAAPNAISREKLTSVQSLRCACRSSKNHKSGSLFLSFPMPELVSTPVGPPLQIPMAYCTAHPDTPPSSMGYGWRSNASARVFENGESGAISYRNESGNCLRWNLVDAEYVRTTSDNRVLVAKVSDPDATYLLTFPDQSVREFNEDGRLMRDLDRNGNALTYDYSGDLLSSMTDAAGSVLSFDYTGRSDGQPVAITSGTRSIGLSYNDDNQLETITDPTEETTGFVYNEAGLLWKILDTREEEAVVYSYDDHGRVVSENSYGLKTVHTYYDQDAADLASSLGVGGIYGYMATVETDETEEDPAPDRVTVLVLNHLGNVAKRAEKVADGIINVTEMEYHDEHHSHLVTKIIQPNTSVTEREYTEQGYLSKVTDNNGNETVYLYTEQVDESPFNPLHAGLVRKIQSPQVTVNGLLVDGPVTEFQYDSLGNLIRVIDALTRETLISRRSDGLVESITDRRGFTTTMTYRSGDNRLETITTPAGPDDAPARTITLDYDDFGNVISVTDPLNRTVSQVLDEINRVTRVTNPLGKYVEMGYVNGRLETIEAPTNAGSSSHRRTTTMSYDDANRLLQVNAEIDVGTDQKRVGYAYDGFSQLKALQRLKDSEDKATAYQYDRLGRPLHADDFLSRRTSWEYAPFCTENTVTTPRGIRRKSSFDSLCQLTQVETQDSQENPLLERQLFEYDELGHLLKVTHGAYFAWLDEEEETPTTKGGHFGQSNFPSTTSYEYDLLHQVTSITQSNGETTGYTYDEEGNVLSVTFNGRVTEYTYYHDGRLYTVTYQSSEEDGQTFTYVYDEAGQLLTITYPETTQLVASFTQTNDDPGWNDNGQLVCLRYLKEGEHFHRFEYSYDDSGNRTQFIDTPLDTENQVTWNYGYDWLNRLTSVSRNSVTTSLYAYDESDNRIELQLPELDEVWTYSYDIADQILNRSLADDPVEEFTHDNDGNMIARTQASVTTHYDWDLNNRLQKIRKDEAATQKYSYDAGGIRNIHRDEGAANAQTRFYSSAGMSLCDQRPSGPVSFIQGHQLLGLEQLGSGETDRLHFFITDGLGSVRLVVDDSGNCVGEFKHDEFGRQEASTVSAGLSAHSYVGGLGVRNDTALSGLLYMRQRYYDPQLGRFLNQDPIGFAGGLNLFTYAGNNPINAIDPSGNYLVITFSRLSDLTGLLSRLGLNLRSGTISRNRFELRCSDGTSGRLKDIIENSSPINFDLSAAMFVGSLTSTSVQTIDIDDLSALSAARMPGVLVNGLLQHELDEGYRAQTGNQTLSSDAAWNAHHPGAVGAENTAIGPNWTRLPDDHNTLNYSERTPQGTVNHTLQVLPNSPSGQLQVIWH